MNMDTSAPIRRAHGKLDPPAALPHSACAGVSEGVQHLFRHALRRGQMNPLLHAVGRYRAQRGSSSLGEDA